MLKSFPKSIKVHPNVIDYIDESNTTSFLHVGYSSRVHPQERCGVNKVLLNILGK